MMPTGPRRMPPDRRREPKNFAFCIKGALFAPAPVAAWSALPEAIRRAVLALVDSTDLAQT